jgi:hypothetical protein
MFKSGTLAGVKNCPVSTRFKVIALLFAFLSPVYAYADPGSGVLIYQILAGAFVGAIFYVRKIVSFLAPSRRKIEPQPGEGEAVEKWRR